MSYPSLTRRQILRGAAGIATAAVAPGTEAAGFAGATTSTGAGPYTRAMAQPGDDLRPYDDGVLPAGVRSRFVANVNGLRMHLLEAGSRAGARAGCASAARLPGARLQLAAAAAGACRGAGYHVMAPDLRGYGRTDGAGVAYDDDLRPFRMLNEIRDMLSLVAAFGYRQVHLAGHDFGSLVASWCAVARPDVFRSVVLMSAPFGGTASAAVRHGRRALDLDAIAAAADIDAELASLDPPRHHYRRFYATRRANADLWRAPQGVHDFLRAYYHMKSGDWDGNRPEPLREWSAAELARLPPLLCPRHRQGNGRRRWPSTCRRPPRSRHARWLPDDELRVYSAEYERTGIPGRVAVVSQRAVGVVHLRGRHQRRPAGLRRAEPSTSRRCSSPGHGTGASTSGRARWSGWRDKPAPTCGACTC